MKNKSEKKAYAAAYYQKNKEKIKAKQSVYYQENSTTIRQRSKKWYENNLDQAKKNMGRWKEEHPEHQADWRKKNADSVRDYSVQWCKDNRGHVRNYVKNRYQNDVQFNLACRCRGRLTSALRDRSIKKAVPTFDLIGCTVAQLADHLESLFSDGMNWDNRDEWEVDHIVQVASFDLTDPEQLRACFHYTNLRPLWRRDNRGRPQVRRPKKSQ